MDEDRLFVTGNASDVEELERLCKEHSAKTERCETRTNTVPHDVEGIGVVIAMIRIIAKYDVIPKIIVALGRARKKPCTLEYFVPDKGWLKLKGYSAEDVTKIMQATDEIRLSNDDSHS